MDEFNPYAAPKAALLPEDRVHEPPGEAWQDRNLLKARKGAVLPDRCVKCNVPAEGYQFKRSLTWLSPYWFIALLVVGPLPFLVVYLIVSKKGKITVGLCPQHRKRRRQAIALGWLTAFVGIGAMIATGFVPDRFLAIPLISGLVILLGGMIGGSVGSRVLLPDRIDKNFIWLRKVSPEYLATFPYWNA
jgi:hypothetical protein